MHLRPLIDAALEQFPAPGLDAGPGVVVVAVTTDQRSVVTLGRASLEHPVELVSSTPLYVASLAKVVTAWCIHRLVADGSMALDDPVSRWLDVPWGASVTIDQLLQHRSGLPELHALRLLAGRDPADALVPADVRRMLDRMDTLVAPGAEVSYNNTNYATLAMVVEAVTGRRFADAAHDLAFSVLDMPGAVVRDDPGSWIAGMASGYIRRGDGWERAATTSTSVGDGGMWWSGDDLAGLLQHLLADDAHVAAMRRRSPLPDGSIPSLGRGLAEREDDGWFGAAAEFFGARAELRVYPDLGLAVGVMANSQSAPVGPMLAAMVAAAGVPPPPPPPPLPALVAGPVPDGVLVGDGGSVWRFRADEHGGCSAIVGELHLDFEPDAPAWRLRGRPSVCAGWEGSTLIVRDGERELARLRRSGGVPVDADHLAVIAGLWWCPAAAAVLEVSVGPDGASLTRGQAAPEPLVPVAVVDGAIVMAAPWGLLHVQLDGRSATAVLARAAGVAMHRLVPAG